MHRSPKACLSRHELVALHQLSFDAERPVSGVHRQLLLSMKLIALTGDRVRLTAEGRERLKSEHVANWTPVYRPRALTTAA